LLREVDRRIGLTKALAECIADRRDPAKIRHELRTMLAQRIFGIALDYEDLNDQQTIRDDPFMAVLAGTELARAQVGTIRVKLLKVAARVVTSVRRVVFHLSSGYPYQALFRLLVARLTAC
jgi:hypothetical protein